MAVLLQRVEWYGSGGLDPVVVLQDVETINVSKGATPKSNTCEIKLKNAHPDYLDSSNNLKFQENDIFKVYVKNDITNAGISTAVDSTDLLMVAELKDIEVNLGEKEKYIKLDCVDRTYTLLNRLWSYAYTAADSWTAPTIIQNVIRNTTDNSSKDSSVLYKPDGTYGGGVYEIDARLESAGGYIEDTRPTQGTPDSDTTLFPGGDNTKFPFISLSKSFKPVYEWIDELSQVNYCNTINETDSSDATSTLVVQRAMRYYVDEKYRFHWFYPTDTPSLYLEEGIITAISPDTSEHKIRSIKGKKAVFDIINFIIFRAGTDMNGATILGYQYDPKSTELKPTYRPFVRIAEVMKYEDSANLQQTTTGDSRYWDYPASYPVTPAWDPEQRSVANDGAYNTNFREIAIRRGKDKAKAIIQQRTGARWKLDVVLSGENLTPADLVNFTSDSLGLQSILLRIKDVKHNITKTNWTTTITIEEDEEEREL